MIIFDLDGTLADCEYRRHFVDPLKRKDKPIKSTIFLLEYIGEGKEYGSDTPWVDYSGIEIWSGRCESQRKKTEKWLEKHLKHFYPDSPKLKMRPIGNSEPDEVLKERWLDEALIEGKQIDFVFDDRPKVIRMWRRRGIFVFNCCQHEGFHD